MAKSSTTPYYECTRPSGHEGSHVACGLQHNYHTWEIDVYGSPWKLIDGEEDRLTYHGFNIWSTSLEMYIARVGGAGVGPYATAKLIASAPDLLRALQALMARCRIEAICVAGSIEYLEAENVVAKVTGK